MLLFSLPNWQKVKIKEENKRFTDGCVSHKPLQKYAFSKLLIKKISVFGRSPLQYNFVPDKTWI